MKPNIKKILLNPYGVTPHTLLASRPWCYIKHRGACSECTHCCSGIVSMCVSPFSAENTFFPLILYVPQTHREVLYVSRRAGRCELPTTALLP